MARPTILNPKLIKKIADKVGKPPLSVVKSVSALASRRKIPSEVALIVIAKKYGIGTSSVLRKLDPYKQTQLSSELNNAYSKEKVASAIKNRKSIKSISIVRDDFSDPYLPDSIYKNIPAEGYSIMFILENSVRLFIMRVLYDSYGENWWTKIESSKSLDKIPEKVKQRKNKDTENWYHSKRGAHEIYYTDYSELLAIIRSFEIDFAKFFNRGAQKNLIGKLEELSPSRNVIAHNNPITLKDLDRLKVHTRDWFSYMKKLNS